MLGRLALVGIAFGLLGIPGALAGPSALFGYFSDSCGDHAVLSQCSYQKAHGNGNTATTRQSMNIHAQDYNSIPKTTQYAKTVQNGNGNTSHTVQIGGNMTAHINQTGNDNYNYIHQEGDDLTANILQVGNGHWSSVSSTLPGDVVTVNQVSN